jgi:hypothetical protein
MISELKDTLHPHYINGNYVRSPSKRNEPRVEFLGEQDGLPERALKAALQSELAQFTEVKWAYLARVGFAPNAQPGVALCLAPLTSNDSAIAQHVGKVFASQFSRDAHLDVIFVSPEQEADLRRVCKPFYARAAE